MGTLGALLSSGPSRMESSPVAGEQLPSSASTYSSHQLVACCTPLLNALPVHREWGCFGFTLLIMEQELFTKTERRPVTMAVNSEVFLKLCSQKTWQHRVPTH